MLYVSKAAPVLEELTDRLERGLNVLEIQLLFEATANDVDIVKSVSDIDIVSVHTPIIKTLNKAYDISVEYLSNLQQFVSLNNTCWFAQEMANLFEHDVYVILHNGFSKEQYVNTPILTQHVVSVFQKLIDTYPNVRFSIENVVPVTFDDRLRNGIFLSDTYYLVDLLNRSCGEKFGITFDTCHWLITEQFYSNVAINEKILQNDYKFKHFDFNRVFEKYGKYIDILHINNYRGGGSTEETHGIAFMCCSDDINTLHDIFKPYLSTGCKAYVTLDVKEENFTESLYASAVKEIVNDVVTDITSNGKVETSLTQMFKSRTEDMRLAL